MNHRYLQLSKYKVPIPNYKEGDAAVCLFTRENIRKVHDQEDWIKEN